MHQTYPIIDMLESLLRQDQKERDACELDALVYKKMIARLPKWFPCPDDFFTQASGHTECDLCLRYYMHEGEKGEPLRMLLSMVFEAKEWNGIYEKEDDIFGIRSIVDIKGMRVMLLMEVDKEDYAYIPLTDNGTHTTGPVSVKNFIPYDILRRDVTPAAFHELQLHNGMTGSMLNWYLDLLARLIMVIPPDTPIPEHVQGAFLDDHDIDFFYPEDSYGTIRTEITQVYPDCKWYLTWDKEEGAGSLATIVETSDGIKIRMTIELPNTDEDLLLLIEDASGYLYYRAAQMTDPDFEELLVKKYERLDES
jgi:hypothetical protein